MRNLKKLLSVALALCMVAGMLTVGASAASDFEYTLPEEPVDVSSSANIMTTMTQRAGSEIPLVFGINVVGGNAFDGLIQMGGTSVNVNPDPFVWNYNYITNTGKELPEGTYYNALGMAGPLNNPNGLYNSGGANQNYSVVDDEMGGVGYALAYRNDVIIGFNSSTVDQIDLVRTWREGDEFYQPGDENYAPLVIDVQTGTVTSRLYCWTDMGQALSAYLADHPELSARYGDPYTLAVNLEEFSAGIPYYIASLIADGTIAKKTAAYVYSVDGSTYNCKFPEGAAGSRDPYVDVYGEVKNFNFLEGSYTLDGLMKAGVDVIMLELNSVSESKQDVLMALAELGYGADEVPIVMDGSTIQLGINNGYNYSPITPLFVPYIQSYAYMDELARVNPAINPVAMWQYAVENFFHISESSAADVALYYIGSRWDSVDEDYDQVPDLANYKYDKSAIETAIKAGIQYALSDAAVKNDNVLLAGYSTGDNAYLILTTLLTDTVSAGHDAITLTINGQTKYLDLTELAVTEGQIDEGGSQGGQGGAQGGAQGGNQGGAQGGAQGGSQGGAQGGAQGNNQGSAQGGGQSSTSATTTTTGDDKNFESVRTSYQAIIDYYATNSEYGYGDDLQTTLQKYADHMVAHVWKPDTSVPGTYGYGLTGSTSSNTNTNTNTTATNSFTDVASGIWYENAVNWAVAQKITTGTGDGTAFSPANTCTVGEILTFLWRAKGSPEPKGNMSGDFSYDPSAYYYKAIMWALENGVMDPANAYDPNHECTRSLTVEFLWKAAGSPSAAAASFTDMPADASYAQAVAWAVAKKVTTGTGDGSTFSPDTTCDRGTIVTFLYRTFSAA